MDEVAKASPEVVEALKRRGITDLAILTSDGSTGGYNAMREDEDRRLA